MLRNPLQVKYSFLLESQSKPSLDLPTASIVGSSKLMRNQAKLNNFSKRLSQLISLGGYKNSADEEVNDQSIFLSCHNHLRTESFWNELKNNPAFLQLRPIQPQLKTEWMKHAFLSHFTPEALFDLAHQIYKFWPEYKAIKRYAQHYQVKGICDQNFKDYETYLDSYGGVLVGYQQKIAEAFSSRITCVLDSSDLTQYEPIEKLHVLLASKHIEIPPIPERFKSKESVFPLARAYDYGLRRGNDDLKTHLQKQLDHDSLVFTIVAQGHARYFFPSSLTSYIPLNIPLLPDISTGKTFRYKFVAVKQPLLINLHLVSNRGAPLRSRWDFKDGYYNFLEQVLRDIAQERDYKYAQKHPEAITVRTMNFLTTWDKLLKSQHEKILIAMLDYLDNLIVQKNVYVTFKNANLLMETRSSITKKLNFLKSAIESHNNHNLLIRGQNLSIHLLRKLEPPGCLERLEQAVHSLTQDKKTLLTAEFNSLYFKIRSMGLESLALLLPEIKPYYLPLITFTFNELVVLKNALINKNIDHFDSTRLLHGIKLLTIVYLPQVSNQDFFQLGTKLQEILSFYQSFIGSQSMQMLNSPKAQKLHTDLQACCYSSSEWLIIQQIFNQITFHLQLKQVGDSSEGKGHLFFSLEYNKKSINQIQAQNQTQIEQLSCQIRELRFFNDSKNGRELLKTSSPNRDVLKEESSIIHPLKSL